MFSALGEIKSPPSDRILFLSVWVRKVAWATCYLRIFYFDVRDEPVHQCVRPHVSLACLRTTSMPTSAKKYNASLLSEWRLAGEIIPHRKKENSIGWG